MIKTLRTVKIDIIWTSLRKQHKNTLKNPMCRRSTESLGKGKNKQHNTAPTRLHFIMTFHTLCILYRLTHTNTAPLDTLQFSTTVKGKNRWMKERKMKDADYDMKQNMCSFLLTARTSSLWPSWPALCTARTHARKVQLSRKVPMIKKKKKNIWMDLQQWWNYLKWYKTFRCKDVKNNTNNFTLQEGEKAWIKLSSFDNGSWKLTSETCSDKKVPINSNETPTQ